PDRDLAVVAREQHFGNLQVVELRWPGVLGVVEQTAAERVLAEALGVAERAGGPADDGFKEHQAGELSAHQHGIPYRDLARAQSPVARVEALEPCAQQA